MRELSLSYADANSGNNASTIGWINFGNIFLNPGEILTGLYVRLFDGSILSFDLKNDSNTDTGFALRSTSVPVTSDSNFGVLGYTNISGNIALIKTPLPTSVEGEDSALFTLSNISYLSSSGTPISRFTLNVVDLYNLNSSEDPSGDSQQYITNRYSSTSANTTFKFSYIIAWLVDTNVNGVEIISSPSFHLFCILKTLTAKWRAAVSEFRKWALFSPVYAFHFSSNSTVLYPIPVHPFSRHSLISSKHSSILKVGTNNCIAISTPYFYSLEILHLISFYANIFV